MADEKGIKELLEAIKGITLLGVETKKIMKDGKVNLDDITSLQRLFEQKQTIFDAVEGVKEIPAEAKDLSAAEVVALVQALLDAFKEIKAA